MEKYHDMSDECMEVLQESFETLIDSIDDRRYEVEYSVCGCILTSLSILLICGRLM